MKIGRWTSATNSLMQGANQLGNVLNQARMVKVQDETTTAQIKVQEAVAKKIQEYNETAFQKTDEGEYRYQKAPIEFQSWAQEFWETELSDVLKTPGAKEAYSKEYQSRVLAGVESLRGQQIEWQRKEGWASLEAQAKAIQTSEAMTMDEKLAAFTGLKERGLHRGYIDPVTGDTWEQGLAGEAWKSQVQAEAMLTFRQDGYDDAAALIQSHEQLNDQQKNTLLSNLDHAGRRQEAYQKQEDERVRQAIKIKLAPVAMDGDLPPDYIFSDAEELRTLDYADRMQIYKIQESVLNGASRRGSGSGLPKEEEDRLYLEYAEKKAAGADRFELMEMAANLFERGVGITTGAQLQSEWAAIQKQDPGFAAAMDVLNESNLPEGQKKALLQKFNQRIMDNAKGVVSAEGDYQSKDQRFTAEDQAAVMRNLVAPEIVRLATSFSFDDKIFSDGFFSGQDDAEKYLLSASEGKLIGRIDDPDIRAQVDIAQRGYRTQISRQVGIGETRLKTLDNNEGFPTYKDQITGNVFRVTVAGTLFNRKEVFDIYDFDLNRWERVEDVLDLFPGIKESRARAEERAAAEERVRRATYMENLSRAREDWNRR